MTILSYVSTEDNLLDESADCAAWWRERCQVTHRRPKPRVRPEVSYTWFAAGFVAIYGTIAGLLWIGG